MIKNIFNKVAIYLSSFSLFLALSPTTAFAHVGSNLTASASGQSVSLTNQHQRCDTQVDIRLDSLNKLSTRVGEMKKLTDSQKSQMQSEIQTNINGLTSLKTKCDADTDFQTLLSDTKSIYTTYRIYAVFEPQVRILAATDRILTIVDQFTTLWTSLQTRVQNAGNPSNLTSLLTDMQNKISDAKTQANSAQNLVISLTPQSYNSDPTGTRNTIQQAVSDIKTAASDLRAAWIDAKSIRQSLGTTSGSPTSPTPTI